MFQDRNSIKSFPFILIYKKINLRDYPILFGVSVSKRNFKNATDRNRIKRLVREVYRMNKITLYDQVRDCNKTFAVMFLYIGKEEPSYHDVNDAIKKSLSKLRKVFAK